MNRDRSTPIEISIFERVVRLVFPITSEGISVGKLAKRKPKRIGTTVRNYTFYLFALDVSDRATSLS